MTDTKPSVLDQPIRFAPLNDGSEEDCQCARCGSSCVWIDCDNCGGQGEYDDYDNDFDPSMRPCHPCEGKGGWNECGSSAEWCEAHPMAGREHVEQGKLEWFTIAQRAEPDRNKPCCTAASVMKERNIKPASPEIQQLRIDGETL